MSDQAHGPNCDVLHPCDECKDMGTVRERGWVDDAVVAERDALKARVAALTAEREHWKASYETEATQRVRYFEPRIAALTAALARLTTATGAYFLHVDQISRGVVGRDQRIIDEMVQARDAALDAAGGTGAMPR